jgi:sulfur carrier protein
MSDPTVDITVNGKVRTVSSSGSLADLIGQLGHAPEGIATALNGQFVARDDRHERILRDGDQVTCFQAIVGG